MPEAQAVDGRRRIGTRSGVRDGHFASWMFCDRPREVRERQF
jgi:hypothetical protein